MMEPKYTIKTNYTFEKYKKFSKLIGNKYGKFTLRVVAVELLLILVGLIRFKADKNITSIFFISALIFPFVIIYRSNKAIKSVWESNKIAQSTVLELQFYDDRFIRSTENSNSSVEYENIYDIFETDDSFYIMISKNQGFIIDKEDCGKELSDFIMSIHKKSNNTK